MTQYKYVTVMENQQPDPRNGFESGEQFLEAGKRENPDYYEVLDVEGGGFKRIEQEPVHVFEAPHRMTEEEIMQWVRENHGPEEIEV